MANIVLYFCVAGIACLVHFSSVGALTPGGDHVITKRAAYYAKESTKVAAKTHRTTCTKTGFWLARRMRCRNIYYTVYKISYKTVTKYHVIYVCKSGYKEVNNQCKADCGSGCKNGGTCIAPSKCSCWHGWGGNMCENPVCGSGCENGGTCISPGTCTCRNGWNGNRCQNAVCSSGCGNGGTCTSPGTCTCRNGWGGSNCHDAVCSSACQNGGTCTSPGICTCRDGWMGNTCQKKNSAHCSDVCQNGGTCKGSGICSCRHGWNGDKCQHAFCFPACLNGGSCSSPGTCLCTNGWTGNACEKRVNSQSDKRSDKSGQSKETILIAVLVTFGVLAVLLPISIGDSI